MQRPGYVVAARQLLLPQLSLLPLSREGGGTRALSLSLALSLSQCACSRSLQLSRSAGERAL